MASLNEVVKWMESKKKQLEGRMAGCNISDGRCSLLAGAGRTPTLIERYSYGSYGHPAGQCCWKLEIPPML